MAPQKRLDVRFAGERVEKTGKKAEKGTVVPEVEKKSVKRDADAVAEPVEIGRVAYSVEGTCGCA